MQDVNFAEKILLRVRDHFPQEYPLNVYQFADVLIELGMEARKTDTLMLAQRLLDAGAYLNQYGVAQDLQPEERPSVPLMFRLWYRLRGKEVYEIPAPIDIVFTGPPGPGNECVFVEVEQAGRSISTGKMSWIDRQDGTVALRLPGHFH